MSAPLLGDNQQSSARVRHHGSFRKLFRAHPINALKTLVRRKLPMGSKGSKRDDKKSKYAPTIDTTSSQSSDTPPSTPPPPLTTLPPSPQDIRLFDFEGGSTNHFKSLDSANAEESDDLSSSDDGVNLWDLAGAQDTEEIDHLLIQIMNNSSMFIRRTGDSMKGKEQIDENVDSILSISPDHEDDTLGDTTEDNEPSDDEEDSIPDVFVLDQTATSLNIAEQTNMKNKDVDSALAWSALSLLLGSPAPASVTRKSNRKEGAKLWDLDAGAASDDIPDLPSSASEDELECVVPSQQLQSQAQEAEEEGILYIPDVLRVSSFLKAKEASPRIDQNGTFTTASLTSSDDPSLSRSMFDFEPTSALDIPGDEDEDSIPDIFMLDQTATSLNVAEETNMKDEDVDSALAWSALGFFLGSPALASVTKKSSRKESAKLWDLDAAAESDDIPDIPDLPSSASENDLECVTY